MKKWSAGIRCVTGLAVCMTAAACGESATQTSEQRVPLEAMSSALSPGVDFVVSSVTVVGAPIVERNQPFNATVKVCNQGNAAGPAYAELYLSEDAVITPPAPSNPSTDISVAYFHIQNLAAGQCATEQVPFSATVPSDGKYYLGAVAAPYGGMYELFTDNNARTGTRIAVGMLPDFTLTAVSGPASALPGSPVNLSATVCNPGTQPGSTTVQWYLSPDAVITPAVPPNTNPDLLLASASTQPLAPGQCQTVTATGYASGAPDSVQYVGAVVDPFSNTPELFEENNTRTGNRMGLGDRPDLVVSSVTGPASARPHEPVNATVTVCNQGTANSFAEVELYLSQDTVITPFTPANPGPDLRAGFAPIGPLAAGQCQTVTAPLHGGIPEGAWYLGAVADPFNGTQELIEDNNTRAGTRVTVQP